MLLELVPRTNLRKYITSSSLQYVSSNMWKAGKLKEVQARACVAMKARSNMPSKMRHGHGRDRRGHTSLRKENLKQMQKSGCKKAGAMSTDKQKKLKIAQKIYSSTPRRTGFHGLAISALIVLCVWFKTPCQETVLWQLPTGKKIALSSDLLCIVMLGEGLIE